MSGHEIYAEDSALYLKKAGDVGNPEIKVSFDAIKENVVVEMEVNMDDGNFSVLAFQNGGSGFIAGAFKSKNTH